MKTNQKLRPLKRAVQKLVRKAGYEIRRTHRGRKTPPNEIHFLHIGKNAGTQITELCSLINQAKMGVRFVKHGHEFFLRHLPPDARYFFAIRDPITRFRSGFYSRKRKGQPRIYSEWSTFEEKAFANFDHANDLAEALFEDGDLGRDAFGAIKSISHTAQNQVDWVTGHGNLFQLRPPVAIIRQKKLEQDFEVFKNRLGISLPTPIVADPVRAHKNNYDDIPALSEKAIENLKRWYWQDVIFNAQCEAWIVDNMYGSAG